MRSLLLGVIAAFLIPSASLRGQETDPDPEESTSSQPPARRVTALMGVGNDLGWLGGQVEAYFSGDRLSAFVGLGYTPEIDTGDPTGVTPAAGVRAYTAGSNHRVFGEASVSQISTTTPAGGRHYGPGVQVGYQYVADGWFTFFISGGAGVALGVPEHISGSQVQPLVNLGAGYTWR